MKLVLIFNYFKDSSLDKIFIVCFKGNCISKRLVLFVVLFWNFFPMLFFYINLLYKAKKINTYFSMNLCHKYCKEMVVVITYFLSLIILCSFKYF